MEVWEEGEYIPIATLSPPERPALRQKPDDDDDEVMLNVLRCRLTY